jgi:hypothetical protein
MITTTYKIFIAILIVAAFGMVASSASAAGYSVYVSAGSGSYSPYYDTFYSQPYYYDYSYYNYYPSNSYNFNGNYNISSFWNSGNKFRVPANPPKPANVAPITISGLGFNLPQNTGAAGTPIQPTQTPVCSFGSTWNGSSCVTAGVACPSGSAYNAGMNICLPNRIR